MAKSEELIELAVALSLAQGKMETAKKESRNPFYTSVYADLASVWEACRGPLSDNGLSVIQTVKNGEGNKITITTMLLHKSGQWVDSELSLEPRPRKDKDTGELIKNDIQSIGSAITYGRRYCLAAMVGVCPDDDDDGNAASDKNEGDKEPAFGDGVPKTQKAAGGEHWCKIHNAAFFKKGNMKSYAHPIAGTKEWCNEPAPVAAEPPVASGIEPNIPNKQNPTPLTAEDNSAMQAAVDNADKETAEKPPDTTVSSQNEQGTTVGDKQVRTIPEGERIASYQLNALNAIKAQYDSAKKYERWNEIVKAITGKYAVMFADLDKKTANALYEELKRG